MPTRWQELGALIAEPGEADLAGDFLEMLIEEGLVVPQALGTDDWHTWNRGAAILARLKLLLREARPGMQALSPGLQASSRWGADERWIYNGFTSGHLEIGLGFSANESPKRPESPPIIWAYIRDPAIPKEAVAARTAAAIAQVPDATAVWSGVPTLSRPAADILTASDFRDQVQQAVHFAFSVARRFQEVGYLPADLSLIEPSQPPGASQASS